MHTTDWPGRAYGARAPGKNETPLSAAEVAVGLQDRTIGADMPAACREEAIETLIGDTLLPVIHVAVPAGAWGGHTPLHPGIWGGLLAPSACAANNDNSRRHA